MTIVSARVGGRPVVVGRPAGSSLRALCVDVAELFDRARREQASAWILPPAAAAEPALRAVAVALRPSGAPPDEPAGLGRSWLRARWRLAETSNRIGGAWRRAAASFWLEMYRELRRHIGDERLPYPWRTRLRRMADGCFRRSRVPAGPGAPSSAAAGATLAPDVDARLREVAAALGVSGDRPLVALDLGPAMSPDLARDAITWLVAHGYTVARIGDARMGPLEIAAADADGRPAVVDLPFVHAPAPLDAYVVLHARVVVCASDGVQALARLTGTPCLFIGGVDPLSSYPDAGNGMLLLKRAVALETGAAVTLDGRLADAYLTHLDGFAHRTNTAAEILAAVREMHDGLTGGWSDSPAQARFRVRVAERLAARAGVAGGEVETFARAGRLARVQADAP